MAIFKPLLLKHKPPGFRGELNMAKAAQLVGQKRADEIGDLLGVGRRAGNTGQGSTQAPRPIPRSEVLPQVSPVDINLTTDRGQLFNSPGSSVKVGGIETPKGAAPGTPTKSDPLPLAPTLKFAPLQGPNQVRPATTSTTASPQRSVNLGEQGYKRKVADQRARMTSYAANGLATQAVIAQNRKPTHVTRPDQTHQVTMGGLRAPNALAIPFTLASRPLSMDSRTYISSPTVPGAARRFF